MTAGLSCGLNAGPVCDDSATGAAYAEIVALYKLALLIPLPQIACGAVQHIDHPDDTKGGAPEK